MADALKTFFSPPLVRRLAADPLIDVAVLAQDVTSARKTAK